MIQISKLQNKTATEQH